MYSISLFSLRLDVMVKFLEMVANLKFDEKPNYDKFRQLLRQGLKEGGFPDDGALVFPCMNKGTPNVTVRSPAKKRAVPPPPVDEETENGNVKQKAKTTSIKKSREPCSPKVINRYVIFNFVSDKSHKTFLVYRSTRRTNLSPDCSSDTSSQSSTTAVAKKKSSTEKKERPKSAKLDESLQNPTPAMQAIIDRRNKKEEDNSSPAPSSKRKQARFK